jgi:hypothetical protein
MPNARPSDALVDQLIQLAPLTDVLPRGWEEVEVTGVERRIVVGPGGLFVIVTRAASIASSPAGRHAPWNGVERRRGPSTAQVTAELVAQLISTLCERDITCSPIVLLDDDDSRLFARLDEVPVLHRRRLTMWLHERPVVFDRSTIELIRERSTAPRPLHSV